ncbi:MAG TPA: MFS transporter [Chloroflexi bacterium]|nr:MFS transporter [Chloroflexota bacterium]
MMDGSPLNEYRFHFPVRVRYNEVDPQQIVFNSRYLEYCDAGFPEYFREAGVLPLEMVSLHSYNPVVVQAELDFIAPARLDDLLEVSVRVAKIGRTSLTMKATISQSHTGALVFRAQLTYVNIDPRTGEPAPVPASIRRAIEAIEVTTLTP